MIVIFSRFRIKIRRFYGLINFSLFGIVIIICSFIILPNYPKQTSKAAEFKSILQSGYGCYEYGGIAGNRYSSCQIVLRASDMSSITSFLTPSGVSCSPIFPYVETKITCKGTLAGDRLAPTETMFLSVSGQTEASCSFSGQNFSCADLSVGSTAGSFGLLVRLGSGQQVAVDKKIFVINGDILKDRILPRTGGLDLRVIVIIFGFIAITFFIWKYQTSKKNKLF